MKRNGIDQLQMNDVRGAFGIVPKAAERCVENGSNGESHVAEKIERSISFMLQHLNQPLQVATLAAAANVSPSHFSALFKRWTGSPPIDFFIHLRMQQACRLFDNTSLNVKEVAAALGYDDPFYFSRTFKAVNRVAPSEYRIMPEEQKNTIRSAALIIVSPHPESNPRIQEETDQRLPDHELIKSRRKLMPLLAVVAEPLEVKY